jgi:hypothetical protein
MINIESAITTTNTNHRSVYEWLINQDHVPFDMSSDAHGTHYQLYWYTKGKLHADSRGQDHLATTILLDSVKVDKNKLRDLKLIELLS